MRKQVLYADPNKLKARYSDQQFANGFSKIQAIKDTRNDFGMGLKEAKDFVEAVIESKSPIQFFSLHTPTNTKDWISPESTHPSDDSNLVRDILKEAAKKLIDADAYEKANDVLRLLYS